MTKPPSLSRRKFLHSVGAVGAGLMLGGGASAAPKKAGPIKAGLKKSAVPRVARPLPLSAVRLTGGPLKHAQNLDAAYLLALEPDRMMAFFRKRVGLVPKAAGYGGWDGDGRNLTGHIAGHYLSAVSLMFAATGNARFKERADYMVREMKEVQDRSADGYLGALQDGHERFAEVARGDIRSGGFDLNGLWSPWYVQHKIFAGLRDAYRHTGSRTALAVETRFAAWAEGLYTHLDNAQCQQILRTEFGGMNEVLADLYADTGDPRWMALSDKFQHHAVLDPLAQHQDQLGGLHANTQIPKLLGSLARYIYTGNAADGAAATFFWDAVVHHHSFATGGHGKDEYFGPPDEIAGRMDGRTCESCNVYNMLKLTRSLFSLQPRMEYAEFQEQALFNHALASIDPKDGRTCYMVPVGQDARREYQDMFENFTCCVGSGMENHALHGDGIYYENGKKLWVNLYTPSRAQWQAMDATLTMDTNFPEGSDATLRLTLHSPKLFTLALRRPSWAGDGFAVTVNGKAVKDLPAPGASVEISRIWKSGDSVSLILPKVLRSVPTPDDPHRAALLWGPLVLAGDLGPEHDEQTPAPAPIVFVAAHQPLSQWLHPVPGTPSHFRSDGAGHSTEGDDRAVEVAFAPFYSLHRRTYNAYWDLYTPQEWQQKAAEIALAQSRKRRLDAATVGYAQPGQMQTERDFNEQGEDSAPDRVLGRPGRRGRKWFSFDLPVDPAHPLALILTTSTQEFGRRTFNILLDGQRLAEQTVERVGPGSATPRFAETEYAVPPALVQGKKKATIRFEATQGNEIAAIFGIRIVRTDAPRD